MNAILFEDKLILRELSRNIDRNNDYMNMGFIKEPKYGEVYSDSILELSILIEKKSHKVIWDRYKDVNNETLLIQLLEDSHIYQQYKDVVTPELVQLGDNDTYESMLSRTPQIYQDSLIYKSNWEPLLPLFDVILEGKGSLITI